MHTGDVIRSQDDFLGSVVNKAARIAAVANPSQILVSDATHIMVGSNLDFRFAEQQTVILKGLKGEHTIYTPSDI